MALLLGFAFAAAPHYINKGECYFTIGYFIVSIILGIIFIVSASIIRVLIKSNISKSYENRFVSFIYRIIWERNHPLLILTIIIFLLQLPLLILLYPGTLINDSWWQLNMYQEFINTGKGLSDHHPIIDTFILGIIIFPLTKLFANVQVAFFIYVLIQSLCTSFAFAFTLHYADKKLNIRKGALIFFLLMYIFLPLYTMSVQTISKDAFFSWIFIIWLTLFVEIIRSKGDSLNSKSGFIYFILISLSCCVTKKVSIYILTLSIVMVIIFLRKKFIKLLSVLAIILAVMFIIMPLSFKAMNITKGGKQEMLSMPFQMTARYVTYYKDEMPNDELEVIDKVIGLDNIEERYDPLNADPIKGFGQRADGEYYDKYIKVWFKEGKNHPKVYFESAFAMMSGWFSLYPATPLLNMNHHTSLRNLFDEDVTRRHGFFESTAEMVQNIMDTWGKIPVLNFFISYGLYAILIPSFAVCTLFNSKEKRKNKYWLVAVPIALSVIIGLFLAPLSMHIEGKRYLYPLTYSAPLILMWLMYTAGFKNKDKDTYEVNDSYNNHHE